MSLVLEVFKDRYTGGLQVSLTDMREDGSGTGYRILGPKFLGNSERLAKKELDSHDVASLSRMLAHPTDSTQSEGEK